MKTWFFIKICLPAQLVGDYLYKELVGFCLKRKIENIGNINSTWYIINNKNNKRKTLSLMMYAYKVIMTVIQLKKIIQV